MRKKPVQEFKQLSLAIKRAESSGESTAAKPAARNRNFAPGIKIEVAEGRTAEAEKKTAWKKIK